MILQKSYVGVPPWLNVMYSSIYFSTCVMHQNAKKNDLDHFCIDCRRSLCSNCLPSHDMHHKRVKVFLFHIPLVFVMKTICVLFWIWLACGFIYINICMLLKIRRYVYNDVVNRQDLCKLFNCSGIQVCKLWSNSS